ncbi:NlpC/P60 family protein [Kribbella sp. NPDC049227]|uniref:NlpC/P60 family protein n=1 Tax=Kribbella sp. NPDC049227 TaxID=3364113 RepID=UPI003718AAF5
MPRVSGAQATAGRSVELKLSAMTSGDIIAFSIHGGGIDHVGMYAGNGKNVEQVDLTDTYWSKLPRTVRRFL